MTDVRKCKYSYSTYSLKTWYWCIPNDIRTHIYICTLYIYYRKHETHFSEKLHPMWAVRKVHCMDSTQ